MLMRRENIFIEGFLPKQTEPTNGPPKLHTAPLSSTAVRN